MCVSLFKLYVVVNCVILELYVRHDLVSSFLSLPLHLLIVLGVGPESGGRGPDGLFGV